MDILAIVVLSGCVAVILMALFQKKQQHLIQKNMGLDMYQDFGKFLRKQN